MKAARGENRLMKGGTRGENVEIVDLWVVASDVGLTVDHPEDLAEIVARQIGINHLYRPARHEVPDLLQHPSPHIDGGAAIRRAHVGGAKRRTVIGKLHAAIRAQPYPTAPLLAWADPGVVAKLKACKPQFCEIVADGLRGWIEKSRIWGVDSGEIID